MSLLTKATTTTDADFINRLKIGDKYLAKVNNGYQNVYVQIRSTFVQDFTHEKMFEVQVQHENGDVTVEFYAHKALAQKFTPVVHGCENNEGEKNENQTRN